MIHGDGSKRSREMVERALASCCYCPFKKTRAEAVDGLKLEIELSSLVSFHVNQSSNLVVGFNSNKFHKLW